MFAAVAIVLLVIGLDRLDAPLRARAARDGARHDGARLGGRPRRARAARAPGRDRGGGRGAERPARAHGRLQRDAAERGRARDRGAARLRTSALARRAQRLFDARRELAQSQRLALAGQMAASVAHQVGTPLNLISGYVQMIQAEAAGPGRPAAAGLPRSRSRSRRVTTIVQCLLDQHAAAGAEAAPARRRRARGRLVRAGAPLARRGTGSSSRSRSPPTLPARRRGSRAARAGRS